MFFFTDNWHSVYFSFLLRLHCRLNLFRFIKWVKSFTLLLPTLVMLDGYIFAARQDRIQGRRHPFAYWSITLPPNVVYIFTSSAIRNLFCSVKQIGIRVTFGINEGKLINNYGVSYAINMQTCRLLVEFRWEPWSIDGLALLRAVHRQAHRSLKKPSTFSLRCWGRCWIHWECPA